MRYSQYKFKQNQNAHNNAVNYEKRLITVENNVVNRLRMFDSRRFNDELSLVLFQ